MNIKNIKEELAGVFDDNLRTVKWHNIVDYFIIGLICLSTIEVFLSTIPAIEERYHSVLLAIDYFTIAFFTIEVALRIWCCDVGEGNEKYRGWKGKFRYCFSFYGFIDIISTYPFYLSLFLPFSYTIFKVLRTLRLLRLFRYMESFELLTNALKSKKNEFWISFQFLFVATIVLALIAFFVENAAQPESSGSSIQVLVWAFAQYVGDPGGFVTFEPVTFVGRCIALLIGLLQIALFAVPAGLIGAGFSEQIEAKKSAEELQEKINLIVNHFKRVTKKKVQLNKRVAGFRFFSLDALKTRLLLSEAEILDCVRNSDELRFRMFKSDENLAYSDMQIVENCKINTKYGYLKENRNSKITIVNTQAATERGIGHFVETIASNTNANYITREKRLYTTDEEETIIGSTTSSFYVNFDESKKNSRCGKEFVDFLSDLQKVCLNKFNIVFASGASTGDDFVVEFGKEKGTEGFDFVDSTIKEDEQNLVKTFYETLERKAKDVVVEAPSKAIKNYTFTTSLHTKGVKGEKSIGKAIFNNCKSSTMTIYVNIALLTSPDDEKYYGAMRILIETIEEVFGNVE